MVRNNLPTAGPHLDANHCRMNNHSFRFLVRPAWALAVTATLGVSLAACGSNGRATDATRADAGTPTTSVTSPTPTTATGGPAGTTPGSAPDSPASAAYPSAITNAVVDNPAFTPLERDITQRITEAQLPGASLLVLQDGKLVEQDAFGSYDLTTTVPIASASKWFSGATIMTLVDDGLLDLDATVRTYLPDTKGPSGNITVRQLMAFTSGLEYDERIPCMDDMAKTLAECNAEILALPLIGKPGTGYRYTSTHLHVAAGLAEAVTHQTWEEIFQERIAQPLGMTSTSFVSGVRPVTAADGHPNPAGSAWSTLGDYGRFLEMLVHDGVAPDGARILSSAAIAEMATDQTVGTEFISAAPDRKANDIPYGIGHWLDVVDADGKAIVESSPGKFGFRPWIDHENNIAGVYLIVDKDDEHVADSPDNTGGPADVQTSGNFVLVGTAKALGGKMPTEAKR
jgi:CubicO group peptidase (beta-lactamase class C family)